MKRNGIFLITALAMLFLFSQAFGAEVIHFSASSPDAVAGEIAGKAEFKVDVSMYNESTLGSPDGDWVGGGFVLGFSSPDGSITQFTHVEQLIGGKTSTKCLKLINSYSDLFGLTVYTEYSWGDGTLPDTLSLGPLGTEGLSNLGGPIDFYEFHFQIDYKNEGFDNGTFCIDSIGLPPSQADFDWLFGAPWSAVWTPGEPVCWTITGLDVSDVKEISSGDDILPQDFTLSQNYPNPFNPRTQFDFALPTHSHVTIDVFNILGQKIKTLADADYSAGRYTVDWDGTADNGSAVASGVYFYRMNADDFQATKKLMLLK